MARRDARGDQELRQLALETGLLSRADGSAKFACGPVTVLASIAGPQEVRLRDELVDRAALDINIKPVRGLPGPSTKALADTLFSILEPILLLNRHPRSLVQLSLQTIALPSTRFSKPFRTFTAESTSHLSDDDNNDEKQIVDDHSSENAEAQHESVVEKAAAINASICALIDAAIGMKAMICAVGLAILPNSSEDGKAARVVLDPSPEEERDAQATLCVAFAYGQDMGGPEGDVCYFDMSKGFLEDDKLDQAINLARSACTSILAFIRKSQEVRYTS